MHFKKAVLKRAFTVIKRNVKIIYVIKLYTFIVEMYYTITWPSPLKLILKFSLTDNNLLLKLLVV